MGGLEGVGALKGGEGAKPRKTGPEEEEGALTFAFSPTSPVPFLDSTK